MRLSKKYGGIQFFAPALGRLQINFDSHVISVSGALYNGVVQTITTSGAAITGAVNDGDEYIFDVILENGYIIDTATLLDGDDEYGYGKITSKTDTSFGITAGTGGINQTVIITSKQGGGTTMSKSVDLTTLTGWANLADGAHNITVVAKASGYADSDPSTAVEVTKGATIEMPSKGDLITLDSKQYRVLKTTGTVAEVLCMYDANSSIKFDSNSSYNNTYADKNIDTYCNNTFYSGLSSAMKSAIVDKTFTQDSWSWSSSVPTPSHYTGKDSDGDLYYLTLSNAAYGNSITRHCYCLSVQDVLDYLEATTSMGTSDTTLTNTNIWQMFWNATSSQSGKYIWLRSADAGSSNFAFFVNGSYGSLNSNNVSTTIAARPAFQIDLSKVEWTSGGSKFVQVPVTKDETNGVTVISNMNQSKKYTIIYGAESKPSYDYGTPWVFGKIEYSNGSWTGDGVIIGSQSSNSINFYYGSGGVNWCYGAVLEGDTFATYEDFTNEYPQTKDFAYYICFIEGTLITLADGTKKRVEDITYDDDILCWDFYNGKLTSAKPAWITSTHTADRYNLCKFSNGAEVGFVGMGGTDGYHRIYNDEAKAFTHTGVAETPIGTTTFAEDGSYPKLVDQEIVYKQVKFYNIGTEKHFNLFTNGILTSSRISNCYKIKDMKYYGEQLISDEEIAAYIEAKRNY